MFENRLIHRTRMVYLALFLAWLIMPATAASQPWYDAGWAYRMPVTIDNTGSTDALMEYQVKVALNSGNFAFADAQPGGDDVLFTDDDGVSLLSFWIENWDGGAETATLWVKVPSVPALGSGTVFMYYGNPGASSASDGPGTFEFYDDFETDCSGGETGWTIKPSIPEVKADNTAAVYNDKLYVFGGYDRDPSCVKSYLDETYVYDPATDGWTPLADMPTGRWGPLAVEFDGLIHVFAGEAITGSTAAHEVYDPATDSWAVWSDVPSGLARQGLMGLRYGDKIHLFYQYAHYEYDPVTDVYTPKADVPTPRTWGTCALVGGKIYVIGGYSYGTPSDAIDVNEIYDPATDTWSFGTPMPVKLYGITRENPVIDDKIYVTHGKNPSTFFTTVYVYDPALDSWEQKSSGYNPRDGHGCGVINDKLYVVGGRDVLSCAWGTAFFEEYDPSTDAVLIDPWVVSDPAIAHRDMMAAYEGSYGFMMDKPIADGAHSATHFHDHERCAIDAWWHMTDYYGTASVQPQGVISPTGNVANGSLYFYNYTGDVPKWVWYDGALTPKMDGAWNQWYPVTIVWDGANSKAIVDGNEFPVAAAAVNSDRIYLRINKSTRQYFDLFRVRKYVSPEPGANCGPPEANMPSVADISGHVTHLGSGMLGVKVMLIDPGGEVVATTDPDGYYLFEDVPNGAYTVELEVPLGFVPLGDPQRMVTLAGEDLVVNFELEEQPMGKLLHEWWWKYYLGKLRDGVANKYFDIDDVEDYCRIIFDRFYDRGDGYAIQIDRVTHIGDPPRPLNFDDVVYLIVDDPDRSYAQRARKAFLVDLLNIASGRLSQLKVVSADGATVSQAITYFHGLYHTGYWYDEYLTYVYMRYICYDKLIPAGKVDLSTPTVLFKPEDAGQPVLPNDFALNQNYPNPFNPNTEISFMLPLASDVRLDIYNITGQRIATLVDRHLEAGSYSLEWNARNEAGQSVATGIYLYRLTAGDFIASKKMILLK